MNKENYKKFVKEEKSELRKKEYYFNEKEISLNEYKIKVDEYISFIKELLRNNNNIICENTNIDYISVTSLEKIIKTFDDNNFYFKEKDYNKIQEITTFFDIYNFEKFKNENIIEKMIPFYSLFNPREVNLCDSFDNCFKTYNTHYEKNNLTKEELIKLVKENYLEPKYIYNLDYAYHITDEGPGYRSYYDIDYLYLEGSQFYKENKEELSLIDIDLYVLFRKNIHILNIRPHYKSLRKDTEPENKIPIYMN